MNQILERLDAYFEHWMLTDAFNHYFDDDVDEITYTYNGLDHMDKDFMDMDEEELNGIRATISLNNGLTILFPPFNSKQFPLNLI
mgnify:CR=1 FL=1